MQILIHRSEIPYFLAKFPDGTTATDLKQQDFKEYIYILGSI